MALNLEDPTGGFLDPLGFFDKDKTNPYTSNKDAFDEYARKMEAEKQKYNGYFQRGDQAGQQAFNAYQRDLANPNAIQDQIASGYSESPYAKYINDMVTKRLNYNSANTGMLGSGAANRALMQELTKNTGQFEGEYVNRGLGVYGQALGGMNTLQDFGLRAGGMQDALEQESAGGYLKGLMGENETNDRNRAAMAARDSALKGEVAGAFGAVLGTYFGGPEGGKAGAAAGSSFGNGPAAGKYQGQQTSGQAY
jgi:hypothetical protein